MDDIKKELAEKLAKRSSTCPINGCWLYNGYITNYGYGQFRKDGKKELVHRLSAWIYLDYDLNSNLQINHDTICPNRNCWNWMHLYVGTQAENLKDAEYKGNRNKRGDQTNCINGHEYIPENTFVNKKGIKVCRICQRDHNKEYYRKNKQSV